MPYRATRALPPHVLEGVLEPPRKQKPKTRTVRATKKGKAAVAKKKKKATTTKAKSGATKAASKRKPKAKKKRAAGKKRSAPAKKKAAGPKRKGKKARKAAAKPAATAKPKAARKKGKKKGAAKKPASSTAISHAAHKKLPGETRVASYKRSAWDVKARHQPAHTVRAHYRKNPGLPEVLATGARVVVGSAMAAAGIVGAGMVAKKFPSASPKRVAAGLAAAGVVGGVALSTVSPVAGGSFAATMFTQSASMVAAATPAMAAAPAKAVQGVATPRSLGVGGVGRAPFVTNAPMGAVAATKAAQVDALHARFMG